MKYNFAKHLRNLSLMLVITILVFLVLPIQIHGNDDIVRIDILTVNDFHGALVEGDKIPGAAKLATFLKHEKSKNPTGILILSGGDMFQGSADSNILYGQPVIDIMNEIDFDAMAIGNHEFDWGIEVLDNLQKEANFPFLAANITAKDPSKQIYEFTPYTIIQLEEINIGIIGISTPKTAYTTKHSNIENLKFEDPKKTIKNMIPILKENGADVIVVLSHLDSYQEKPGFDIKGEASKIASIKGIDAIVSAHSHLIVSGKVSNTPIVQAGSYGKAVGKISIFYSKEKKKVISSEVSVFVLNQNEIKPDQLTSSIVNETLSEIFPFKNQAFGETAHDIVHHKYKFSPLGQWTSDLLREASNVDIFFQNGGGLRAGLKKGYIRMGNIYEILPFDNTLVTVELTGKQIIEILEYGILNENIGMLQFSGINVVFDESLPRGKRVVSVTTIDGEKLDLKKRYNVATNDFMADGGNGYKTFKNGENIVNTHLVIRDLLVEEISKIQLVNFKADDRLIIKEKSNVSLKPAA